MQRYQALKYFRRAQIFRLEQLEPAIARRAFHRAWRAPQAAAGGPIRLRQDERNVVPGVVQPEQRALSEFRGSRED